ncbi:hypothetical protein FAM09_12950 [Niastella caeni]|uniref:Uncharacterized protein n=1 Tax=Niastella caeni TaxID=2569763 RepID=A0A4S8HUY4_9BACT|nr:hypothetical protein [Niastella caeni]THU39407.1 hypothetical protein FAM09_12950 [Niastella caeni]
MYSSGIKGTAFSLSVASNVFTAVQVHDQYMKGGVKNINPVDATSLTLGTTGVVVNGLGLLGYEGGAALSTIGRFAGFGGLAITAYQSWSMIYQPIFDLDRYYRPTTGDTEADQLLGSENDKGIYNWTDYFDQ